MVIFSARNLSRTISLHFTTNLRGNAFPRPHHHHLHLQYHPHHRRAYALFQPFLIIKPTCKSYKTSKFFHRSFSSSSSSRYSGGFLKWYMGMLQTRPFLTKGVSSSLIFGAADATSQIITLLPTESFESLRTLRIAGYGLLIMGPSQHLWFNFLSRIIPGTDVLSTLKKILMGQGVFGPIMNSIFFSYNAALQGETREEIVARLKRDLLPTLRNGLMYWPLCDFLTFRFIPVHLQPLANSSFAYLWTIYLTYMASLKKVSAD